MGSLLALWSYGGEAREIYLDVWVGKWVGKYSWREGIEREAIGREAIGRDGVKIEI